MTDPIGTAQEREQEQTMSEMSPLAKDAPVMVAWEAYKSSGDYQNTRNWALHKAHVDGSLWAAFEHGYRIAGQSRIAEVGELREALDDCVASLAAIRATADNPDEWALSAEHFSTVCLDSLKVARAALSLQRRV